MAEERRGGFRYAVSDAQLAADARMTLRQRLEWVDAARILTLKLRTRETAIRQERLRQGLSIDGPAPPGFVA